MLLKKIKNPLQKILEQKKYEQLTYKQINKQHQQLRQVLKEMNHDLTQKLQKKKLSFFKKQKPLLNMQFNNKQLIRQSLIYNQKQLNSLNYQYKKLEIRKKQIEHPGVKLSYDQDIDKLKMQIKNVKLKIKQQNRENILREKYIQQKKMDFVQGQQVRNIQQIILCFQIRNNNIKTRLQEISSQKIRIINQNYDLDYKAQVLQNRFKQIQYRSYPNDIVIVDLDALYKEKIQILQSLGRKRELNENNNKNQYYKKLKLLDDVFENCKAYTQKIKDVIIDLQNSKKKLQILIEKLKLSQNVNQKQVKSNTQGFMLTQISDKNNFINNSNIEEKKLKRLSTEGNQTFKTKNKIYQNLDNFSQKNINRKELILKNQKKRNYYEKDNQYSFDKQFTQQDIDN